MNATRRSFLAGSLAAVGTASSLNTVDAGNTPLIECLDYGRSFICNTSSHNRARFWIESRTVLYDDTAGTQTTFYQCGSCKSEDTFAKENLLTADNYDFMPIYGGEDLLILRRHADARDRYRDLRKVKKKWGEPVMRLHYGKTVDELTTFEDIRDVTATDTLLAAHTEITNEETGLRCLIEYPIKTNNIQPEHKRFQVDTGPVPFPDFKQATDSVIDSFEVAHVCYNTFDIAEFVLRVPTPMPDEENETCRVVHYSDFRRMSARNTVFAIPSN